MIRIDPNVLGGVDKDSMSRQFIARKLLIKLLEWLDMSNRELNAGSGALSGINLLVNGLLPLGG